MLCKFDTRKTKEPMEINKSQNEMSIQKEEKYKTYIIKKGRSKKKIIQTILIFPIILI